MKNSDRYKDIFGSKENLTRADIESYESTSIAGKNSVEQKMENDSFEKDAMEGWEKLNYETSSLDAINSKLFPKKILPWKTAIGALSIGVLSVFTFQHFYNGTETDLKTVKIEVAKANNKKINLESADVILPVLIEQMNEVVESEQITASEIINDFEEMDFLITELPPLKPIEIKGDNTTPELVSNRFLAKEIYLHELKLIDYSDYRKNPIVQTKQLILNGLPADKEDKNSESYNSNWESIDVPYLKYLEKSIYYFNKGRNKKALARFETIMESYPKDVNANFYGGLCLFNLGEYTKAISYFDNCLNGDYNNFDEEAKWITALSFEKMNDTAKANILFQEIVNSKTFYTSQAKEKLK
ncbi:MAG TPA: hypothetical protein EYG86_02050 [Crocinitomicaceae bacterium]|nr:hypothetical protein [Crocinitomicaceae bacterium]